ncbi:MAG: Bax inhibitor-1/YccA family protein [Rickettsia endosymbiont of Ixodes persulcatus]|nr:Bax inhibitor-1/YccA family protein [Rickettsia endosymbiont of Ixodes persulcatus]MCZ6902925.1 Bax inhibitor-1/YccA family protein [Rickettsia endosymbiont of Ixodes persulcatus]MCZ6908525.1 Bax inhibitor-1/YccA family protein [Rickettsia endosymbiont of Ixodes persulcatus]MCZ6910350.1 Bax inhibitor-1/YccA family protein [Rickettsia endosymbiont of Ixodes persulcatus]MCZ6914139.1 Bax inhibitor-1/YccA family protein [Rickettsia endosymbiont of Ixodes persulcatus]
MIDYTTSVHTTAKTYDAGLRQFMLKVYNLMATALLLTGSAAIITISWTPLTNLMFNTATISIARTFFICAAVFAMMSLYGYNTNKDLTSWGSFFLMGLVGLLLTSLINFFLQSPAVYFASSFLGVIVFIGLIAWDTQKMSIVAAFNLYLDFINLFLHLIRFLGGYKRQQ